MEDLQLSEDICGDLFIPFFIGMDTIRKPVFFVRCIGVQIDQLQ